MVKGDSIDDHEVLQVVFVRRVITVPGNNVKGRVILVEVIQYRS